MRGRTWRNWSKKSEKPPSLLPGSLPRQDVPQTQELTWCPGLRLPTHLWVPALPHLPRASSLPSKNLHLQIPTSALRSPNLLLHPQLWFPYPQTPALKLSPPSSAQIPTPLPQILAHRPFKPTLTPPKSIPPDPTPLDIPAPVPQTPLSSARARSPASVSLCSSFLPPFPLLPSGPHGAQSQEGKVSRAFDATPTPPPTH